MMDPAQSSATTSNLGGAAAGQAARTKSKAYQTTIAAEADDMKYESKYKELKKKVKEVEEDNDQLYVKILQAQQSVQRLRLERALIYERLAGLAPPPIPVQQQAVRDTSGSNQGSHHHSHHPTTGASQSHGHSNTAHHPHPLSQSFTPSQSSNLAMHPPTQSSTASQAKLTRDKDIFQQSSPHRPLDRSLPQLSGSSGSPAKEQIPYDGGRHRNVLPPLAPAPYHESYPSQPRRSVDHGVREASQKAPHNSTSPFPTSSALPPVPLTHGQSHHLTPHREPSSKHNSSKWDDSERSSILTPSPSKDYARSSNRYSEDIRDESRSDHIYTDSKLGSERESSVRGGGYSRSGNIGRDEDHPMNGEVLPPIRGRSSPLSIRQMSVGQMQG